MILRFKSLLGINWISDLQNVILLSDFVLVILNSMHILKLIIKIEFAV